MTKTDNNLTNNKSQSVSSVSEKIPPNNETPPRDIFDSIIKYCHQLSKKAVLSMINGLFDKDYPLDSKITYNWTEFVDKDTLRKKLADTIVTINDKDSYHIEAQIDGEDIVMRVFEYGFHHSMRNIRKLMNPETNEPYYEMDFPHQLIIYLDKTGKIPDTYPIKINFQGQKSTLYHIPVMKFQQESIEEIRKKHLTILLPFKLLSLRHDIEKSQSQDNIDRLLKLYRDDILSVIQAAQQSGEITSDDAVRLTSVTRKLIHHLYRKYEKVWEAIQDMYDNSLGLDMDEYLENLANKQDEIDAMKAEIDNQKAEIDNQKAEIDKKEAENLALREEIARLKAANQPTD